MEISWYMMNANQIPYRGASSLKNIFPQETLLYGFGADQFD